jgi:hypothetical protein
MDLDRRTSTPMVQPILIEITECILDFLHDDVKALKNCSLVCKLWLPTTRFHLFRSLTITPGNFFQLSSPRESTLCNVIMDLRLERLKLWKLTEDYLERIAKLTALRSLVLVRVDICRLSPAALEILKVVDLRRLYFAGARTDNIDELMQIPCAFSSLESLSLCEISINNGYSTLDIHLPPTLRELAIESNHGWQINYSISPKYNPFKSNSDLTRWVLRHEPIPPITSLSLGITEPFCGRIAAMLHKSLEHLELKLFPLRQSELHIPLSPQAQGLSIYMLNVSVPLLTFD